MLNLIQHLTKSMSYETLKQVQGDKSGLFTNPSILGKKENKFIVLKPIIPLFHRSIVPIILSDCFHFFKLFYLFC